MKKLLMILLCLAVGLIPAAATASNPTINNPYYRLLLNMPFEKTAGDLSNVVYDYSGNNYHALEQDAPGWNSNPLIWLANDNFGRNGLYYFDGADDYLGFSTPFNFNANQPFTINVWVNPSRINNVNQFIIGNRDQNSRGWNLRIRANNKLALVLEDGSSNLMIAESDFVLRPERWYQVSAIYDGNQPQLYLNGAKQSGNLRVGTVTNINSSRNLRIGLTPTNGWGFNGYIDNLKIWQGRIIS